MRRVIAKFVSSNRAISRNVVRRYPRFFRCEPYGDLVRETVRGKIESTESPSVLEIGGIDRPLLSRSSSYRYVGLDIDYQPRCAVLYDDFLQQGVEQAIPAGFDVIVSITLLEHLRDNALAMRRMYDALAPGGLMVHYVPSKLHPYSIALRVLGPSLQRRLIPVLRPGAEGVSGYPAFFDRCSAPEMRELAREIGFESIKTAVFYRANDYFSFFLPLFLGVTLWENVCKAAAWERLGSGFVLFGEKAEALNPEGEHQRR